MESSFCKLNSIPSRGLKREKDDRGIPLLGPVVNLMKRTDTLGTKLLF